MITTIEYALMAGHAYRTTRDEINWFSVPQDWTPYFPVPDPTTAAIFPVRSGFEATSFQRGTEIAISYAGTYPKDLAGDMLANAGLAAGTGSEQLFQAAEYYLQVKAANPNATITLTGHSLGGGLAALIGVFFGVQAMTFDQAPFAQTALFKAADLKTYLAGKLDSNGNRLYSDAMLAPLGGYIAQQEADGTSTVIPNAHLVTDISVRGEFLSGVPWNIANRVGTTIESIPNTAPGVGGMDLHAQALLAAFLQSRQTAADGRALNDVTAKLPDLLQLIFNPDLFSYQTDDPDNRNLLDHLVRNEAANQMVTRFTADLWKLAQDGGLTMRDGNASNADLNEVSKTLIAFAMRMYYENMANAVNAANDESDKDLYERRAA